ncbi:MAG: hypothetical protein GPJ08_21325 [Microcystis aeruginosa G13-09]|nr:hypothetical protein [Microcystis aeruginosa G13-09]
MANIQISDLYSERFMLSEQNDRAATLTILETEKLIGGGMSVESAFQVGLGMVGSGIGLVAMAGLGPVGLFAGGFLYGGGLVLSMYSGYLMAL